MCLVERAAIYGVAEWVLHKNSRQRQLYSISEHTAVPAYNRSDDKMSIFHVRMCRDKRSLFEGLRETSVDVSNFVC